MYVYTTHDYIRMEITVLYFKFHCINCRFNGRKYPFTGSASKLNLRPSNLLFCNLRANKKTEVILNSKQNKHK